MNKFFIITDILPFFPLVGVSFSHSSITNIFSVHARVFNDQVAGPPNCSTKLWFETHGGGTSLVVQWVRLHASSTGGVGSIPGRGIKIRQALWHGQKMKKKKKERNT